MKVKEAIKILEQLDPDAELVSQNEFQTYQGRLVTDIFEGTATFSVTSEGDKSILRIGISRLTDELRRLGYTEEDIEDGEKVVILSCWRTIISEE